ncbi:equilibrative nucleotide transporter 3-like [Dorcoceras hygrometricum]|uniref:Equilibrative nucleotide transporter 3-like n=1 Tax=Dorcoceras hygrometricum TaxID=472368 RepID=A0A2Z7BPC7_9LAMI|nr:equilibrative nucleotide transporter 3-like [Dorcoceras hygrometricum]
MAATSFKVALLENKPFGKEEGVAMGDVVPTDVASSTTPTRLEGKTMAIVYCWFLGLGSLVSWNSMLTIADYYYALFPNYHPSRVLTLVYQPFALGTMAILAYYEAKIDTRKRNIFGYILFCLSTFGLLISFFAGLAASGALTSGLRLITKAVFDKTDHGLRKGVVLFLAISTFLEFLCIFLYAFVFAKLPIVKYFRRKAALEGSTTVTADLAAVGIRTNDSEKDDAKQERLSNKQLLIQNIDYAIDLYLIYVLTLSIFPGFLYENTGTHKLGSWYAVVLVAMYNVWDLIGRYVPLIECIKLESRKGLMIAILSRFALIPAFYFTAKYGDQGWMIFLVSFLGLTNGYLTVCVLTDAPKGYKAPEQNALGNLLVLFLLGGIFSGVALDWLWIIGNGTF